MVHIPLAWIPLECCLVVASSYLHLHSLPLLISTHASSAEKLHMVAPSPGTDGCLSDMPAYHSCEELREPRSLIGEAQPPLLQDGKPPTLRYVLVSPVPMLSCLLPPRSWSDPRCQHVGLARVYGMNHPPASILVFVGASSLFRRAVASTCHMHKPLDFRVALCCYRR